MKTKSGKTISLGIILILVAATLSSLGQLAWKLGADGSGIYAIILYVIGFVSAGLGMFVMMAAFRFGEVSILQPMMSIGFALSILFGALFLNESITWYKLLGTAFIILGSVLLGIEGNGEKV
ncbi:EamA family transporter [Vagococcus vulneris]|uniref:EamA domain-containing protein n=1 Tax=Vagococcus vulneris TaxID=1977869 RepID=A0A430A0Z9_9ENTE|nr:DMT family transporter [Vagococcus vulneris]RSU00085.1 hypothetical protein CBF37_01935 [Vagococcus vulneris]